MCSSTERRQVSLVCVRSLFEYVSLPVPKMVAEPQQGLEDTLCAFLGDARLDSSVKIRRTLLYHAG